MTGSTRYAAKLEKKKAGTLKMIESGIPTAKTSIIEQHDRHVQYILQHLEALFSFYGERTAEERFRLYQGQERAADNMVNLLINGTTKYNKQLRLKKKEDRSKWPKKNTDRMAFCKRKKKKKKKQKVPEEREKADAREKY
ncbi:hypothetical protein BDF20DRAFT_891174 [Mycotypha africana]|uniref:uncharacterized protein n=1 Tax=Mycotypha africana TaxID=64632 RepID=UPI002301EE34|nr:uncharacterized protein BDF20DRAFT_891174 [Mycotypha africana]KAI8970417.1 hypothetical protein BDF20DRAFT_891174 [Mycotypha africana]